ncbi:MAG: hypothetical protein ACXVPE_16290 [Bacteroidia bacterium]
MQKLSLRKYAETLGISHTAVAKAIKAGHISKGYDPKTKKIIVEVANKEWGNEVKEKKSQDKSISEDAPFDETNLTGQDYKPLEETLSFNEARRRKEIYNAEIARVEALRVQGLYVEKAAVYSALSAFGIGIRNRLQAIPDRHIDTIIAAKTRFDAHNILVNAIYEALTELTSPPEIK